MDRLYLVYLLEHYFSVNFHLPDNDKRYSPKFFTIYTIDDGLSFRVLKVSYSQTLFPWYYIPFTITCPTCIGPIGRISAVELIETNLI